MWVIHGFRTPVPGRTPLALLNKVLIPNIYYETMKSNYASVIDYSPAIINMPPLVFKKIYGDIKKLVQSWALWLRTLIPELRKMRQEDLHEFQASLDYIVS